VPVNGAREMEELGACRMHNAKVWCNGALLVGHLALGSQHLGFDRKQSRAKAKRGTVHSTSTSTTVHCTEHEKRLIKRASNLLHMALNCCLR